jgi:molybdate-binding protein/DNA-binding transcriptional regulator YhcF (GntR family)
MTELRLDKTAKTPLYQQIADQVKQMVAVSRLLPGEHLPTVRQLAHSLQININTVVRAYLMLEQERIVVSRRGGGTQVLDRTGDPVLHMRHQRRLSSLVNSQILEALSFGYTPDELETAFHLHLTRWREERKNDLPPAMEKDDRQETQNTIRIVGSHDLALDLLVTQLHDRHPEIRIDITHAGSMGGLIALQQERAEIAGIHLLDEETGEYNNPYIKHILPGREMAIIHLAYRIQGLMFASGNPKNIEGLADLVRQGIVFINRQKGSGTRVLLDLQLRHNGISPSQVCGYDHEVDTHLAIATAVSRGQADVGLGIEAAAITTDLDFLPLFRERYDLVMPKYCYNSELLSPLLNIIKSVEFKKSVTGVGGYDTSETGSVMLLQ